MESRIIGTEILYFESKTPPSLIIFFSTKIKASYSDQHNEDKAFLLLSTGIVQANFARAQDEASATLQKGNWLLGKEPS